MLEAHVEGLSARQQLHYASGRYAMLLIFQGMDSAGKDGAIRHVMSGVNPEGCEVYSFKQPSAEELKHDFLWRTTCRLPERGRIGIFNRSYYEEVLITRAHPEILDTHHAPWYSVPADDKENSRLIVSQILMDVLDDLKMAYPRSTPKRRRELRTIGKQLAKAD